MSRPILLVILGIVASLYFPESRAALADLTRPALTPLFRWQTQHEMGEIARELQVHERENYGRLPEGRGFPRWLSSRFSDDVRTDSWGGEYALFMQRDSFVVVSWGPDGLPRNEDDLQTARRRARPGR